jgi:hypothetical protein
MTRLPTPLTDGSVETSAPKFSGLQARVLRFGALRAADLASVEQTGEEAVSGRTLHAFLLAELIPCVRRGVPDREIEPGRQQVE